MSEPALSKVTDLRTLEDEPAVPVTLEPKSRGSRMESIFLGWLLAAMIVVSFCMGVLLSSSTYGWGTIEGHWIVHRPSNRPGMGTRAGTSANAHGMDARWYDVLTLDGNRTQWNAIDCDTGKR